VTAHVPVEAAPARVSTLELFFDLVFVFTMTQVTEIIVDHPDAAGLAQAAIVLFVIFWMYGGYAWLTNAVSVRTMLKCNERTAFKFQFPGRCRFPN
jgi:low temperature requirement protein LtrA